MDEVSNIPVTDEEILKSQGVSSSVAADEGENFCCKDGRTGLPAHDRLDLIRQTLQYWNPICGAVDERHPIPDFCCFDCPTLVKKILEKYNDTRS